MLPTSLAGAGWMSTAWSPHRHHLFCWSFCGALHFSLELVNVVCMNKSIFPFPDHVLLAFWQQKANKMKHHTDYFLFCVLWELGILHKLQTYFPNSSCNRDIRPGLCQGILAPWKEIWWTWGQAAQQALAGWFWARETDCSPGCVSSRVREGCVIQPGLPSTRKTLMYWILRGVAGAVAEEEKLREVALFSLETAKGTPCCCLQLRDWGGYREGKREIQKYIPQVSISMLLTAFTAGFCLHT